MAVDGLIIPRSYNDYFSRTEITQFNNAVKATTDATLNASSTNPVQNKAVTSAINEINGKIPTQASSTNKLADKEFVNSSVSTNTANYISDNGLPFTSIADLEAYSGTLTNNDYAFVVSTDSAGNTVYNRYKYNASTTSWAFEYALNNSSFTAEQWAAINSGITAALVQQLQTLSEPIGVVKAYAGSTTPAHYLPCDGVAVSRETYSSLYAVIGTTYGAGDGSTTFNVPDYRETVLVGIGKNTTKIFDSTETDPSTQAAGTQNHDIYSLGEFKDDQIQNITGSVKVRRSISSGVVSAIFDAKDIVSITGNTASNVYLGQAGSSGYSDQLNIDASRVARAGTTTHGKQIGVNYIIKYE